jgi:hypothetical protein
VMGGSRAVNELVRCPKGNVHRVQFTSSCYVFLDGFDRRWLAVSNPSRIYSDTTLNSSWA